MASTPVLTPGSKRAPAAPAGDHPRGRRGLLWLAVAAVLALVLAVADWADRPPAPAPASAPATEFSEARARPVLQHLAGTIGRRVMGTPGRDAAAEYLVAALRAIPGVEVQVQEYEGAMPSMLRPAALDLYRTRNVLARIRGDSASAVLVSAHYDSPPESAGAGDNAASVAVALETLRALAAGPRPQHTVIFNFNDGEEAGLLGSNAFLDHPWSVAVNAFVNLESAGPRGKAVLFQAGPGNPWLTGEYARSVPLPYGSVLGQDIFQSGLVPSMTDFAVYRDGGGLRGLDIAFYQDGYAYHSELDRVERVQPGSMQHMGENLLALVRELATGPLPGDVTRTPSVYYDFLGRTMFAYSLWTALGLALAGILLAVGSVVVATLRTPLTWIRVLVGLGITLLATAAGVVLPVVASFVLAGVLGRPQGWYASPELGWATFGALALAGFLFVHGMWERRSERGGAGDAALPALAGSTLAWAMVLAIFTFSGMGTAYLPLWWTVSGALGLLIWSYAPRAWWVALLVTWVAPALLTAQAQTILLKLFIPVAGRLPTPFPFDLVVALLVALPTVWMAATGAAALHRAGRMGLASGVLAVLGVAGLAALALSPPYSAERPKRLGVQQMVQGSISEVVVLPLDRLPVGDALAAVPGEAFTSGGGPGLSRRAETPALPPKAVTAARVGETDAVGTRVVRLSIAPGSHHVVSVRIPVERLAGWSFSDSLPSLPQAGPGRPGGPGGGGPGGPGGPAGYTLRALGGQGWEGTLRIRGEEPVQAEVVEMYAPGRSPALDQVVSHLPAWTTSSPTLARGSILVL